MEVTKQFKNVNEFKDEQIKEVEKNNEWWRGEAGPELDVEGDENKIPEKDRPRITIGLDMVDGLAERKLNDQVIAQAVFNVVRIEKPQISGPNKSGGDQITLELEEMNVIKRSRRIR